MACLTCPQSSEHGACPVIEGQKWAANLWVWNGPRYGLSSVDPETGRTVDLKRGKHAVEPDPTFKVTPLPAAFPVWRRYFDVGALVVAPPVKPFSFLASGRKIDSIRYNTYSTYVKALNNRYLIVQDDEHVAILPLKVE